jgi:hypothetical protein
MTGQLTPDRILELGYGFWGARALLSAVELGVFSELAKGALDGEALRERLGLHSRGTRDFFDALVALGMLERRDGLYTNTPETDWYLDRAKDSYIGGWLEMGGRRVYPIWASLTDALRTGQPQGEATGGDDLFQALYQDPNRTRLYLRAMTGLSMATNQAIARTFPWTRYRTFSDLGAAQGGLAVQLALAHPHLTGLGADLPPVAPIFEEYVASFALSDRLRFQPVDLLADSLPETDVLIMGRVLHGYDLGRKRALIAKAYDALPDGGALLLYEALIDDERRENTAGLLFSLHMLLTTPGGFDYTGADCRAWLHEAGFRQTSVQHLSGADSMVLGIK